MAIEMPVVTSCQIENCGYNVAKKCHAKAITVGDSFDPECDTFLESNLHIREIRRTAGVGACKVTACRFNRNFDCGADSIAIGKASGKIQCLNYLPKSE